MTRNAFARASIAVVSPSRLLAASPIRLNFLSCAGALVLASIGASAALAQSPATGAGICERVKNPSASQSCLAARKQYQSGNYQLSLTMTRKAIAASPKEGLLRVMEARILIRRDGPPGVIERELRQARKDGAPDHEVLPSLFYVMVEQHKEAVLLNEFPEPAAGASGEVAADILRGRVLALRSTDRLQEAAAAMDRLLSLRRDASGLLLRAQIAVQQKDQALAKKLIDDAYKMAPEDEAVMSAKLEQMGKANDSAGVLALADRMQKLYPINSDPQEARILVFLRQKQDAKAGAEVDSIFARRPKSPLGAFYKAVLTARAGDKRNAAQLIQSIPPQFTKAHPEYAVQMAQIVMDNGNVESGAGILGAALSAAPDLLDARLMLAKIRMGQDSPQSAMLLLEPVQGSADPRVQKQIKEIRSRIAKDRAF